MEKKKKKKEILGTMPNNWLQLWPKAVIIIIF